MEANRISFLIRATYDAISTPQNLNQWLREDPSCPQCSTPATLRHMLTGCKVSLSQGQYTRRHIQVLKCLAATLINVSVPNAPFKTRVGNMKTAQDWQMLVDVGRRLTVPPEIAITNLRPDLLLWSNTQHNVYFAELTVSWEDAGQEACEGGFFTSTVRLMRDLGISGHALHHASKEISRVAEWSSYQLYQPLR